ncbi:sensor domain-containing diguanylate cyclase [Paenibacillus sp. FSL W8-0426]|uniref:sensor domain-containing diguanylate cyclase n=1 Tax=Paenibacillus sp. FSL W8-0426 TaxID=2921714 RepID=UPI0030DDCABA
MSQPIKEFPFYTNFNEVTHDILEMANQILRDKFLFLSSLTDTEQVILKVLDNDKTIGIHEGMTIQVDSTVCNRIDFSCDAPLVYEDITQDSALDDLLPALKEASIGSYLGVPIILRNGDVFGTLCAVNSTASVFDRTSVNLFQKVARLFSYYLDLEKLAFRDSLTGAYNRQFLHKYFDEHPTAYGALLFLDLDGFKNVNDLFGHHAGDLVLKEVSLRLEELMLHNDGFVVRLGGDEFVVYYHHLSDQHQIVKQAELILGRLSSWDSLRDKEKFQLSVSIGIIPYTEQMNIDLSTLLEHADAALYQAKSSGKNKYQFYEGVGLEA